MPETKHVALEEDGPSIEPDQFSGWEAFIVHHRKWFSVVLLRTTGFLKRLSNEKVIGIPFRGRLRHATSSFTRRG